MRTTFKRQVWSSFLLLFVICLSSCNPEEYRPEDEYYPDEPENSTMVESEL